MLAALSLGVDLGLGQPMEHMLRATVIATRLANRLGLDADQRSTVYYADLISWIGCHADAPELTRVFRDEIGFRSATYESDLRGPARARFMLQHAAADRSPVDSVLNTLNFLMTGRRRMTEILDSHYLSAGLLADRLGLGPGIRNAVHHTFERWDGTGLPRGVEGPDIPLEMRVVQLAEVVEVHWRLHGAAAAVEMAHRRAGTQFDPALVAVLAQFEDEILADIPGDDAWRAALDQAPPGDRPLTEPELDDLLEAVGDFTDLKSEYRHGHSRAVAVLVAAAAGAMQLPAAEITLLRRAATVHDLGRLGVSNSIWEKAAPLSSTERERVRLYPYLTARIVGRVPGLGAVAMLAGSHRELLDGSGYPKGVDGSFLTMPARLLAAADRYQSLREDRPHRPGLSARDAAAVLQSQAAAGAFDHAAVEAVVSAGGSPTVRRPVRASGLTAREEQILALVALGRSSREIAAELVIAHKTVRNHLEHIYAKAGVTNRVSASLFAVRHGIVPPARPPR